ncbi:hypothetical protein RND81_14G051400 [Saponaria officinalis]|uniref:BHLH domain-containing protein n=1 Tax=Saponaria officinalis TaxID=3572 RepID=A0AAW1GNN9_SAPOF
MSINCPYYRSFIKVIVPNKNFANYLELLLALYIQSHMEKQENYNSLESTEKVGSFATNLDCSSQNHPIYLQHARQSESYEQQQKWQHQQQQQQLMYETNSNVMPSEMPSVDRTLSFADVMQFADFGPKLALNYPQIDNYQHNQNPNQTLNPDNTGRNDDNNTVVDDPVYFLKFPVLSTNNNFDVGFNSGGFEEIRGGNEHDNNPVQLEFLGNDTDENAIAVSGDKGVGAEDVVGGSGKNGGSGKRKRPRTIKTTEEVESQRMTHIAVERNRRKQMNEHLRVLRSLMPSSYVQRGDQASIIGGAIEFVRELEQLLQCLESQKRRRLYGDQPGPPPPQPPSPSTTGLVPQQNPLGFPNQTRDGEQQLRVMDHQSDSIGGGGGLLLQEECAESKSCIADIEVKVLGFDALIKILSRRRHGQLIKAIAALEDLQLTILHTNITTIEHTVLYSFNVKVASETRFTAEDIANSVQQIFTFIHANTDII